MVATESDRKQQAPGRPALALARPLVRVAALLGFSGVALGAFGAHGLRDRVSPGMLEVYRTGVLYHLVHALATLGVALGARHLRRAKAIAALFTIGVALFSGSLYLLALTGMTVLGAITPLGGLAFLAGWALLFLAASGPAAET
jgi:uncharacterized membrane protein YgdD (TMEM256/DUF423 family)